MSSLSNVAKCHDCEKKTKDTPFNWGDSASFDITLEWRGKEEAIKTLQETKCPTCGGENWYFTDAVDR